MKISVIVCAAGKGLRAGFGKNKLLAPLFGAPALYHTLKAFDGLYSQMIVACSPDDREEIGAICAPFQATVVAGGSTRTESVFNALQAVTGDVVLIHDGARPFVSKAVIEGCIESVRIFKSGICAVEMTDTVAVAQGGRIESVPPRATLFALQTPQGFLAEEIKQAYALAKLSGRAFTDDSSVYAAFIGKPHLCAGEAVNKKLTYKSDFSNGLPAMQVNAAGGKIGYGIDVHAFGKGKDHVILCGERIPCDSGLVAHSDGDVAVHALMDALLSAAGLPDIGHFFPDTDPQYAEADSMLLLRRVVSIIREKGLSIGNISLAIQAEKPRLAAHIQAMKGNLSAATGVCAENIAVGAGTCEHLGFVGEGLGICATCAVLLKN